jgi:hypothetical protein
MFNALLKKEKPAAAADTPAQPPIAPDHADNLADMLEGKLAPDADDTDEIIGLARGCALDRHDYHQGEIARLKREIARTREIAEREIAWREKHLAQHERIVEAISAYEDVLDREDPVPAKVPEQRQEANHADAA